MRTFFWFPTIVLVAIAGCSKGNATQTSATDAAVAPPMKVEKGVVERQKMPVYVTLIGSVFAERNADIAANVAGRITETSVERGDTVKAGQKLVVVDSKAALLQVSAANAQSQAAQTQVALATQDCARADTLFQQGAMAKSEYDRQTSQCKAQLYNANAARAQADLALKLAGDTIIRAPIDGIIGERFVNVGEYVQPSSRVATIFSISTVRVQASVPEQAVAKIKEGQTLEIRVSAYPGRTFPAVVKYVSPALRTATRDLIVEAVAKNADLSLKPGMFATVLLETDKTDQLTVPKAAIVPDENIRRIYLVKDGAAFEVIVRAGVEFEGRVAISDDVPVGAQVILNPPAELRDGMLVQ